MFIKAAISIALLLGVPHPQEPSPPETMVEIPSTAKCPQFWHTAIKVGWHRKELPQLDRLIYRESRCNPLAFNPDDPNTGSRGLLQINGFWRPWLRERGVLGHPGASQGLFGAETNLLAGLHIYNYGVKNYNWGWGPWGISNNA